MHTRQTSALEPPAHSAPVGAVGFLAVLIVASAIDIAAWWAVGAFTLDPTPRILVALLPLPGNVTLIALVLRWIRTLDEFQKRIHLEAVVVAFLATGVAVFVYGYLRKAQAVGELNAVLVWAFMA